MCPLLTKTLKEIKAEGNSYHCVLSRNPEELHTKEQKKACKNLTLKKTAMIWMHDLSLILTVMHHMKVYVLF